MRLAPVRQSTLYSSMSRRQRTAGLLVAPLSMPLYGGVLFDRNGIFALHNRHGRGRIFSLDENAVAETLGSVDRGVLFKV
jgi:hypothetical protein